MKTSTESQLVDFLLPQFSERQKVHVIYILKEFDLPFNSLNVSQAARYILGIKTLEQAVESFQYFEGSILI